jgi:hypothetical protein
MTRIATPIKAKIDIDGSKFELVSTRPEQRKMVSKVPLPPPAASSIGDVPTATDGDSGAQNPQ